MLLEHNDIIIFTNNNINKTIASTITAAKLANIVVARAAPIITPITPKSKDARMAITNH